VKIYRSTMIRSVIMRITKKQLRTIIREEAAKLSEAGWGSYSTKGHKMNMASQLVKKAMDQLTGVDGADEALSHLESAVQAIKSADWK
jgi:hypothetical protein